MLFCKADKGRRFPGKVNSLRHENAMYGVGVYAEVAVTDGVSPDYGYLTMKNAVTRESLLMGFL